MRKKVNLISFLLIVITSVISIKQGIVSCKNNDLYRVLICFMLPVVMLLPYMFKSKINNLLILIFELFIFISYFLGTIINLYQKIYCYDKVIHYISGIVCSIFALYILSKYNNTNRNLIFNIIFILSFTMFLASIWEIFEYSGDIIFEKDAQKVLTTGINDTMKDMICALIGSIIVIIWYLFEKTNNIQLFITKFILNNEKKE